MDVFNTGFLVAAHRVTIIDSGAGAAIPVEFQRVRVSEFPSAVSQDVRKRKSEFYAVPERSLQLIEYVFYGTGRTTLHQSCYKEFGVREVDCQDTFVRAARRKNRIHFYKLIPFQFKGKKVLVCTSVENRTIRDLLFVCAFPWLKFHFPLQVNVSGQEHTEIDIPVQSFDAHGQLRMIGKDHVGGLSLLDQRTDDPVNGMQLLFCKIQSFPGGCPQFFIQTLCDLGVVIILGTDPAKMPGLITAITDIRSLFNTFTQFRLKARAYLVALMAGTAKGITQDEFVTGIRLFTMKAVNTKVVRIVEGASVPGVDLPVKPYLFRDSGGIFAEVTGDISERYTGIQCVFDIQTVINGQVQVVSRDQF